MPLTPRRPADWRTKLPWIDAFAGLSVGLLVIPLLDPLSRLYSLPREVLLFTAAANLGYPLLGISLGLLPRSATSARRGLLAGLIVANCIWAVVCIGLTGQFGAGASLFGRIHLVGEGMFVAALAALEWRHRRIILGERAPGASPEP